MTRYLFWWALIAEIAGTIAGFGSSSIFLPIANQILSFHHALILVAIYHIFGNLSRFSMFWRHWNAKIFRLFGIPSIIATVLGAWLAGSIDPHMLKIILGIVLICFASFTLLHPTRTVKTTPTLGRIGWALSGFTAGLIGTWGVLRWAFMTLFRLSKESYVATIASIALLVDVTRIPIYFGQWFLDTEHLRYIPILFVLAFMWSWIGKQFVKKVETKILRKIILVTIIVVSALLAWQWWLAFTA